MSLSPSRAAVALAILTLLAPVAVRAEQFVLPATGNKPPVAEARAYFEFNGNISAGGGAGMTLNGVNVPLSEAGAPVEVDVGGDNVMFLRRDANSALLLVEARSLLAPGGTFCDKSGITGAKNYDVTLNGLPTVERYGVVGLSATHIEDPGGVGTVSFCSCPSRRVPGVVWTSPFPAPALNMGRLPLDVILVLDQSGSMGSSVGGGSSVTRITAMKAAVDEFINTWAAESAAASTEAGLGLTNDRLGITYFSDSAPVTPFAEPYLRERGTSLPDGGVPNWQVFKSDLTTRNPQNMTAMGQGLLDGYAHRLPRQLSNTTVVLMTDGMQNINPRVAIDTDGGISNGMLVIERDGGTTFMAGECTPVLAVSVGTVTSPFVETMQRISAETAGAHVLSVDGGIPDAFADQLVAALKGNTLSTLKKTSGTMGVEQTTVTEEVFLDGTVEFALVTLGWLGAPALRSPPQLRIISPDGTVVTPTYRADGLAHTVQRVDLPKSGKPGMWKVQVQRFTSSAPLPYRLRVVAEEKHLDFRVDVPGIKHATGTPLNVVADLSWDGKPITKLEGELRVRVERPIEALGTLLHKAPMPRVEQPELKEPTHPYQLKVDGLLKDPKFQERMGQKLEDTALPLKHQGDGRYTLEFTDTAVPGIYRFFVELEMKGPDGEPIRRQDKVEATVEVLPDGTLSEVKSEQTGPGAYTLHFTPVDAKGNFSGPGYDDQITVRLGGKGSVRSIGTPDVDGRYQVLLASVDKDTPLYVAVAGTPIAEGTVGEPKPVKPEVRPPPADGGTGPGPVPPPNGTGCGCRRMSSGGMLGVMGLVLLGFISRPRRRRGDE
ncbi:vWA domain-containing protein [Pyxidicoccus xibeiensis]|uniref:hypothetical protein n=1 Tax=Pyxidicoccus xibeiensis TaxID=2906759 RepID=UPI0020A82378|nr:hypothetical protein [Pyxidicoccus xibeiensis]MCP3137353.1 hypothetical protein [Pyxidicoccus xibeiensis]